MQSVHHVLLCPFEAYLHARLQLNTHFSLMKSFLYSLAIDLINQTWIFYLIIAIFIYF